MFIKRKEYERLLKERDSLAKRNTELINEKHTFECENRMRMDMLRDLSRRYVQQGILIGTVKHYSELISDKISSKAAKSIKDTLHGWTYDPVGNFRCFLKGKAPSEIEICGKMVPVDNSCLEDDKGIGPDGLVIDKSEDSDEISMDCKRETEEEATEGKE